MDAKQSTEILLSIPNFFQKSKPPTVKVNILLRIPIHFFHYFNKPGITTYAIVSFVLQLFKHIVAIRMLRELVKILAGLGVNQLIGEN